jgi:hypothetical protein
MPEDSKLPESRLATFIGVTLAVFFLSTPAFLFGRLWGIHYTLEYFAWDAGISSAIGLLVAIFKRD